MAGVAPPSSITPEHANYFRLSILLVDVGGHVLRDIFDSHFPPASLQRDLQQATVRSKLRSLLPSRLRQEQYDRLYPKFPVNSSNFDITLLCLLLRNICGSGFAPTGHGLAPPGDPVWSGVPPSSDTRKEADITRLRLYRNDVLAHAPSVKVSQTAFSQLWSEITAVSRLS